MAEKIHVRINTELLKRENA